MNIKYPILLLATAILIQGCGLANRAQKSVARETGEVIYNEGNGDAYLFDVKIYHRGKKNSVRLDIYQKGDSISLFARGYLGKGVMKGLVESDSAMIYFPTENEFYHGRLYDLIGDPCADDIDFENIMAMLFLSPPSEIESGLEDFYINIKSESREHLEYRLVSKTCGHPIDLEYRYKDGRFILDRIDFRIEPQSENDRLFRFEADRRTSKTNVSISDKKFNLEIPPDAVQIIF